jgi:hypothetical protein
MVGTGILVNEPPVQGQRQFSVFKGTCVPFYLVACCRAYFNHGWGGQVISSVGRNALGEGCIDMPQRILDRLSDTFSVRDIMTPLAELRRADRREDALGLLAEYDVVPYPTVGEISGYFHRETSEQHLIRREHLITDTADLLSLPELLQANRFFFVLAGSRIAGYVHYSDLSKPVAKIPFFALYQMAERKLWHESKDRLSEEMLKEVFHKKQVRQFVKRHELLIKENSDLGWTGVFTFPHIITLAKHFGSIDVADQESKLLIRVRNKLAHSDRNLIQRFHDVADLAKARVLFQQILGTNHKTNA